MTLYFRELSGDARAPKKKTPRFPAPLYASLCKRFLDVALVALTLPFTLPLMLLLMVAAAADGHAPLYRQPRIGRDGRVYELLKIRTMVPDADARLAEHLARDPAARREWEAVQKLRDDPRITRFGRVLRKCSLDELPQLWNVLTGEMSLVGPRPMMESQRPLYPGHAYYRLRPGLTGLWQVSDRNGSTFAARARYDEDYYARLSLGTDLAILWRTVGVVVRGTGC